MSFFFFRQTGKISADTFAKSFFEWEAVQYEMDNICKEEPFTCPACSPDMLAVSVDGNRKHYRFKNASRYYKLFIMSVFELMTKVQSSNMHQLTCFI